MYCWARQTSRDIRYPLDISCNFTHGEDEKSPKNYKRSIFQVTTKWAKSGSYVWAVASPVNLTTAALIAVLVGKVSIGINTVLLVTSNVPLFSSSNFCLETDSSCTYHISSFLATSTSIHCFVPLCPKFCRICLIVLQVQLTLLNAGETLRYNAVHRQNL